MESRPQNPEFRNNPENFHPCTYLLTPVTAESSLLSSLPSSLCLNIGRSQHSPEDSVEKIHC